MKFRGVVAGILTGLMLSTTSPAQAAGFALTTGDFKTLYMMDVESLTTSGSVVKAWVLSLKPQPATKAGVPKPYDFSMQLTEFDCQSRRVRQGPVSYYAVASSSPLLSLSGWGAWDDVIPSSVGEGLFKGACTPEPSERESSFKTPDEALEFFRDVVVKAKAGKLKP